MKQTLEPIQPTVSDAARQALLSRVLGTRARDLAALEAAHRDLAAADAVLHKRFLRWLADHDPESAHLTVGLALLAVSADPAGRAFVRDTLAPLPVRATADVVDYVHGWRVDKLHTRRARRRFQDEMSEAYAAAAGLVRETLAREAGGEGFRGGEILVTLGTYDKVQQVLDHLGLPYSTWPCKAVETAPLRADQVLVVNCPGDFSEAGLDVVRRFVAAGGTLITTDWALHTTVQKAFPGTIEWNGVSTKDEVVQVSWVDPESPFTRGVEVPGQTIRWWLEGSSYPIRVVDKRVAVLMRSGEMGGRYQHDPLVVAFAYGEGMVFHLTSHYYLQRSQGDRGAKGVDVAAALGATKSQADARLQGLSAEQLAAAYSSMRLLANVLNERRRACGV